MIEMSPFYSHESTVGPVFDVATWSRGKTWFMAVCALGFGLLVVATLSLAWQPALLLEEPPDVIAGIHEETLKLQKDNPWAAYGGSAVIGLVGFFSLTAAWASALDASRGGYYFRVGPGGISLCVPHGLDFSKLCFAFKRLVVDYPMDEVAEWQVVQHKRAGAMSRNTGNLMAFFKLQLVDGKRQEFNLNSFREPSFVIHSKINDALQMVPAQFGPASATGAAEVRGQTFAEIGAKYDAILDAISGMLSRAGDDSAVVVSDTEKGRFVQFIVSGQSLLLDLPGQGMNESERVRAAQYFERATGDASTASRGNGYQVSAASIEEAARLALEVFEQVYEGRDDSPLNVELVSG